MSRSRSNAPADSPPAARPPRQLRVVGFLESDVAAAAGGEIPLLVGAAGIALLLGLIAAMLRKVQVIAVGRESLRQVTELVARGVPMAEVFPAIAQGAGRQGYAEEARVYRYEADGSLVRVATWGEGSAEAGQVASAPIFVHGRQWGLVTVTVPQSVPVRDDLDETFAAFAHIAAIAISNAQARDELAESRKRVVTAADEARRKIERDLHDGTQQRLVTLAIALRKAMTLVLGHRSSGTSYCS